MRNVFVGVLLGLVLVGVSAVSGQTKSAPKAAASKAAALVITLTTTK
jgi:hypothetical protein